MKYYIVSDIHGFYKELIEALTEKGYFSDTEPHKLIICGDLLDRGKEINELVDFVLELMKKDEVILIRGNHEDLLIDLVDRIYDYLPNPEYTHHGSNGTFKTALSLAKMKKTDVELFPENFRNRVLCTPFVRKIMSNMVDYYETDNYIFVHGWIPCIEERYIGREKKYTYWNNWRNASKKEWERARWINGMAAHKWGVKEENKTIICGHFHASWGHSVIDGTCPEFGEGADFSPYYNDGIIAIDGCTSYTKKVNCIIIND